MNYIKTYDTMIEIFQSTSGIRNKLCYFFDIKNVDKTVKELIEEKCDFKKSSDNIKGFVKKFYEFGGITEESFEKFQYLTSVNKKPINRVIFAAGDKIDATLDVTYNEISIVEDSDKYLIYDNDLNGTITCDNLRKCFGKDYRNNLHQRILKFSSDIEKLFYHAYIRYIDDSYNDKKRFDQGKYPNLLPQFALKNRVKTIKEAGGLRKVIHRIDFGMVLNGKVILIEIDGPEHYSSLNGYYFNADFNKISNERYIDRELNLEGYEVYRFLNKDINSKNDQELVQYIKEFFSKLFKKHNIKI